MRASKLKTGDASFSAEFFTNQNCNDVSLPRKGHGVKLNVDLKSLFFECFPLSFKVFF